MSDPVHTICPHCDAVNRVPNSRLGDAAKCGKCHNALFVGAPLALTASRFDKHINRSDLSVIVDFWAPWCGPCKTMAPAFAEAAVQLEPNYRLAKVNTEDEAQLAARYSIRSIPTLILFSRGQELARRAGAMSRADIVGWALNAAPIT